MSAQSAQSSAAPEEPQQPLAVSLPETQTTTALALVTQSITELNKVAAEVAALEPKYKGVVFDVKTTAGMEAACEARLAIRKPRYAIQKMQKDAKTPLNALKKGIDDQVDAVIARITAIEDPIHQQISNEQQRKEDEKKAREEAERARVAAIQARIDEIRQRPADAAGQSVVEIELYVKALVGLEIGEDFGELKQQAEGAKATSLIRLRAALAKAQAMEAEQKRLSEERAENERIRQENDARAAMQSARLAEEERQAKAIREEQDNRAKAEREAEERRQREEAELNRGRLEEIQGIQHQLMIATSGRLGVRQGGTRECIVETLEETRAWPITEERFGRVFFGTAQKIKAGVITKIEQALVEWDERAQSQRKAAEEEQRLATERARQREEDARLEAQRAEAERIDADRRAQLAAEEQRIAEERARWEREQEALRVGEPKPPLDPAPLYGTQPADGRGLDNTLPTSVIDVPALAARLQCIDDVLASTEIPGPLLASIALTELLPMQAVCTAAKEWAVFQDPDSKADQKTDRKLAARAREAVNKLLIAVEALPQGAAA